MIQDVYFARNGIEVYLRICNFCWKLRICCSKLEIVLLVRHWVKEIRTLETDASSGWIIESLRVPRTANEDRRFTVNVGRWKSNVCAFKLWMIEHFGRHVTQIWMTLENLWELINYKQLFYLSIDESSSNFYVVVNVLEAAECLLMRKTSNFEYFSVSSDDIKYVKKVENESNEWVRTIKRYSVKEKMNYDPYVERSEYSWQWSMQLFLLRM